MKYNKREQRAVDALYEFASNLKNGLPTTLSSGDLTVINNVLGISLKEGTKAKQEVLENYVLVKGKDSVMLSYDFYDRGWRQRYCYFPFQLKIKS